MPRTVIPKRFVIELSIRSVKQNTKQSIDVQRISSSVPPDKDILHIHELGYGLGAYAAEQWPTLISLKKYKGMTYKKYRNATAKSCLRVLRKPAFNDEFKRSFMIGFEANRPMDAN